jgi:hypothetical protein
MTTTTRLAKLDAWANEARAADTHGPDQTLAVQHGTGVRRLAYVFVARPWAQSRAITVTSAKLRLYLSKPAAGAITLRLRRLESGWSEKQASWKNRPTASAADEASATVSAGAAAGTLVEFDVTVAMQAVADGALYYGFQIAADTAAVAGPLWLAASENPTIARRPQLVVDWSSPPDAPTDLHPSASRFVSALKPQLSWSFGDLLDPLSYQTSYQVVVSANADLSAPSFDTGQVAGGTTGLALASTAFAGLPADGSVRYWGVRVWDESGRVSVYSDPVGMRYCALGVVAITLPAATTPDLKPVVTWSFTPAALPAGVASTAQRAWRAWLEVLVAGVWTIYADSGLVTGTDTSWSPPASLGDLAASYRARVQIADALTREGTVSAPSLAEALRAFAYAPGGGVTDPTGLTATVVDGYAVRLDWARATRPDHWAIEVDGVLVLDGIDVTPTGTAYTSTFYGLTPRAAHTLKLHAVELIGGAYTASPGASVPVTTYPEGIWLVDPTTGDDVQLAGRDSLEASIGETAAVYDRIGERAPVVVTELVRGYEGAVSGLLVAWNGRDPRAMKARLMALRSRSSLRLVLGDLNLPVAIYNVAANPTPDPAQPTPTALPRFEAAFSFVQVGEFAP